MITRRTVLATASAKAVVMFGGNAFAQTSSGETGTGGANSGIDVSEVQFGELLSVQEIIALLSTQGVWPDFLPPELFDDLPYYNNLRLAMLHLSISLAHCQDALENEEAASALRTAVEAISASSTRFGVSEFNDLRESQQTNSGIDLEALSDVRSRAGTRSFRLGGAHSGVSVGFHSICIMQAESILARAGRRPLYAARNARLVRLALSTVKVLPQNLALAKKIYQAYEAYRGLRNLPELSEIEAEAALEEF